MKKCECGCGQKVKPGNRFIQGHNSKNRILPPAVERLRRERISKALKKFLQNNPKEIERRSKASRERICSKETRRKMSIAAKERERKKKLTGWIMPKEGREKISKAMKGRKFSQETLEKISKANKGKIRSKELRKQWSISLKRYYQTHKNHFKGKHHTDESKKKMSLALKGKYRGEKASNWQGGINSLPYPPNWTIWLKEEIKKRDKNKCQNPSCPKKSKNLAVHHIDYDKENCNPRNLILLCKSCHGKTQHNRIYWKGYYQSIMNSKLKNRKESKRRICSEVLDGKEILATLFKEKSNE